MIVTSSQVDSSEFEERNGWHIRPEGACKGDLCVPLPASQAGRFDVSLLAERLGMPLLHDEKHDLWCLGPESGGHALTSASAPDLVLPDLSGAPFALRSLRGQKVLLLAWASW